MSVSHKDQKELAKDHATLKVTLHENPISYEEEMRAKTESRRCKHKETGQYRHNLFKMASMPVKSGRICHEETC